MRSISSVLVSVVLVGGGLLGQRAVAGNEVNLTGFWQYHLSDGRSACMTLAKQNDQGGPATPSYTGKLHVDGYGTFLIYCIQVTSFHVPGNIFSINVKDPMSLQSLCFTVTGSNTMPGQKCGVGWQGVDPAIVEALGEFTATRQ